MWLQIGERPTVALSALRSRIWLHRNSLKCLWRTVLNWVTNLTFGLIMAVLAIAVSRPFPMAPTHSLPFFLLVLLCSLRAPCSCIPVLQLRTGVLYHVLKPLAHPRDPAQANDITQAFLRFSSAEWRPFLKLYIYASLCPINSTPSPSSFSSPSHYTFIHIFYPFPSFSYVLASLPPSLPWWLSSGRPFPLFLFFLVCSPSHYVLSIAFFLPALISLMFLSSSPSLYSICICLSIFLYI